MNDISKLETSQSIPQDEEKNKEYPFISKIVFNNGETVEIANDDIVVFVGPNNVGKSQSLRDIYTLTGNNGNTVVIKKIEINKGNQDILEYLRSEATKLNTRNENREGFSYMGKQFYFHKRDGNNFIFSDSNGFGQYRDLFVDNLDTQARLLICSPPQSIPRKGMWTHPIHYAAFEQDNRKWLSECFKKAFHKDLIPNVQFGTAIPLCIGDSVHLEDIYSDEQERLEAYATILERYEQVQNQGDGIKSFTGILLHLMLTCYRAYLIDEPESFLHPPQAFTMGEIIGQTLKNKQAFISTHSE